MSEQPTTTLAFSLERPTVQVDGRSWAEVSELMLSMEMTEKEGGLSSLELRLGSVATMDSGDTSLPFDDDSILKLGAHLAIFGGGVTEPREIFRGTVTGLEADYPAEDSPTLVVLAEDNFQRARMARRTRLHENATIAALAQAVASQAGLTPVVSGMTANIGTHLQLNESDLAFLRRLLARYDGDLQVVGTEMHVSPRSDVARGTLELALRSQLRRARVLADLAHQTTKLTVAGWDASQGQAVSGTGNGAHLGPGSGRTGAQLLHDALGDRNHHISHLSVTTADEAQATADAAFDSRARGFVVVDGTVDGNAALRVGTTVTLKGLGGRFENDYYVTLARHRWDERRGYETDFTAECAYMGTGAS